MVKCSWFTSHRRPSGCTQDAEGVIENHQGNQVAYCAKHLGKVILLMSQYVDSQFNNMNGDKVVKVR